MIVLNGCIGTPSSQHEDKFLTSVSSRIWSLTPWLYSSRFRRCVNLYPIGCNFSKPDEPELLNNTQTTDVSFGKALRKGRRTPGSAVFTSVTTILTACWSIRGQSLVCWSPSGLYTDDGMRVGGQNDFVFIWREVYEERKGPWFR